MKISEFSFWLDNLLEPMAFKDYCVNGLCVEANSQVTKVVTGVSFRDRLIEKAIEENADAIVVHHPNGFWKSDEKIPVGHFGKQIRTLMRHGISLYGYHLPLDGHPQIGNNALIAKALGLSYAEGFMREGEKNVGFIGAYAEALSKESFLQKAKQAFSFGVQHQFMYGSCDIKKVAICSGSGASGIQEAIDLGCDAFVTGEIKENVAIMVEESSFNLISCGHHRTEVFGVFALAQKIEEELGIESKFIDIDNPI